MTWTDNPGSDAALDAGCRCPVMDNNHGKWSPFPGTDQWFIDPSCPLHGFGTSGKSIVDVELP